MSEREFTLRAKCILPVDRAPIENGRLVIRAGRIESLGSAVGRASDRDLGDAIVFPQFVNSHTHLEFSHLKTPLGEPRSSFAAWIQQVISTRRALAGEAFVAQKHLAIQSGLAESRSSAVAAIGEVHSLPDCTES